MRTAGVIKYVVEEVINKRMDETTGSVEYEVSGKGYNATTWEPASNLLPVK